MRRLQSLNLADNNLSGEIPPALGELPDLRRIYLDGNGFSGTADTSASAPQSATPAPAFYAALALVGAVFAIGSLAMLASRR